jgi:predicted phage terminase large subunit-like protein
MATLKRAAKEIRPQAGPQWTFLRSNADIAIFGGSAGAGKTFAMLMSPMRYRDVPNYGAVIFRRTVPQITNKGGLWDSSFKIYPYLSGRPKLHKLEWQWPNRVTVAMRHLEQDSEVDNWQGTQLPMMMFDELTHFTRYQFTYMLSRSRSDTGARSFIRATCNANADSWVADFLAWWIDENGFAIQERSGVKRWMVREGEEFVWFDSKAEAEKECGPDRALSVTFVPGMLEDNPALTKEDPAYRAKLRNLSPVDRARLEEGNWKIRATSGVMFARGNFDILTSIPRTVRVVRYWDRASRKKKVGRSSDDPDWTAGVKLCRDSMGRFGIVDVARMRGKPAEVIQFIHRTAEADGIGVELVLEQDPGQAGVFEKEFYAKHLAKFSPRFKSPSGDKVTRANPISAQVAAGNVWILRAPWNDAFLTEADSFPGGTHDDQIDGLSGASTILMGSQAADVGAAMANKTYVEAITAHRSQERRLDG